MINLCTDIGWKSLNKHGETICGDHVEVVDEGSRAKIIVLADGLGSGVKAAILSTLTARIISTLMAAGLPLEECVATMAGTLPVCSVRGVAYSTFTIIRIVDNREAEIIQYDNPRVILLRDGRGIEIPATVLQLGDKTISRSRLTIREGDIFVAISDGAIHAGVGRELNLGWQRENIVSYLESFSYAGYTAKSLTTLLLDECNSLYGGEPGDDTTVCTVRIRRRQPVSLMIGPPCSPDDVSRMMALFFAKEGKHIVCGGTTSTLAAAFLNKPLVPRLDFCDPAVPPMAEIDGVDLVTEGVITVNKVLDYARDYLQGNDSFRQWSFQRDGASQIARLLFEEATDIDFYVGKAINPAHQNPELPISFNIKMRLIEELAACLETMGKRIKVSYF